MDEIAGRVLVVDDDESLRVFCTQTLRRAGFRVDAVGDAANALQTLQSVSYDLVLLDIHMPDMDGLGLLEQIRARDIHIPILIVSGMATVEQAATAMRLGARGLILKPFDPFELQETAREIIRKRRAARASDRVAALRPVLQVSERLLGELDLERLQNLIIETVRSELEADRASLMLFDTGHRYMRIVACSGLPPGVGVGHAVPVEGSLAGYVAARRQPLLVDAGGEVSPPSDAVRGVFIEDKIVSALSVPVLSGDTVLGVLNAAKVIAGRPFTEADQELLVLLARQAAIAIENARLYSRVLHSEERYRTLLQYASDAVLLLDADGRTVIDANLAAERLSGYSREELTRLAPHQLLPEIDALIPPVVGRSANGHGSLENREIETIWQTRHEHAAPVAISVSVAAHAGQRLLLVIARDISERQRIAKQLVQAEKLAALGRLSASMAHEINNPLQAISNSVHLLLTRDMPEEKRRMYLEMTQNEINGLVTIVQRILDFYRPSREGMRPIDIRETLDVVLQLTASQISKSDIHIERDWAPELPRVYAVSNHIKQVCINLVLNALEAMPDGGLLGVRAYSARGVEELQEAEFISAIGRSERPQGPVVVIEISDTGGGIPAADLPNIFEPFYTTRDKGTGLGLAVSYSIVEQHHGELAVCSLLERGTTFRIILPAAE
ncbi:MAG: response regulator [Oscillochloris sp.]|nr:response regulator [Oscillochloris sp.]